MGIKGRVYRSSWLFVFATVCFLAPAAQGASPLNHWQEQHVLEACNYIERMGDKATAEEIRKLYWDGGIRRGPLPENTYAETVYSVVTLNEKKIWLTSMPAEGSYLYLTQVNNLASNLVHELVHVKQGQDYVNSTGETIAIWRAGGDAAELAAYGIQLSAQTRWILKLEKLMNTSRDPVEKELLKRIICEETGGLLSSVNDALKEYGGSKQWELLAFVNPSPHRWPDPRGVAGVYFKSIGEVEGFMTVVKESVGCNGARRTRTSDCSDPRALEKEWEVAVRNAVPSFPYFNQSNKRDKLGESQYWRGGDYSAELDGGIVPISSSSGEKPHIVLNANWRLFVDYNGPKTATKMDQQYRAVRDNAKACGDGWDLREGAFGENTCLGTIGKRGTIDFYAASDPYEGLAGGYVCLPCADVYTSVSIHVYAPGSHGPRNKPEVILGLKEAAGKYASQILTTLVSIAGGEVTSPPPPAIMADGGKGGQDQPQVGGDGPGPGGGGQIDQVDQLGSIDSELDDPVLERAEALVNQDRFAEAEAAYQEAIRQSPNNAHYYERYGDVLFLQDKLPEAEQVYRKAVEVRPSDGGLRALLGEALVAQGKLAEAERVYREAIRLEPDNPGHYAMLAEVLRQLGRGGEAGEMQRKADELSPF